MSGPPFGLSGPQATATNVLFSVSLDSHKKGRKAEWPDGTSVAGIRKADREMVQAASRHPMYGKPTGSRRQGLACSEGPPW
jgi:hypothetical protein